MGRRRRRPALDATKRAQVVAVLSVGCSQSVAANFAGCSRSTIRRTAERDPKFARELCKAKSNAEIGLVNCIRSAAKKAQYWRAAAWALERGFPEKYARRGPDVLTPDQVDGLLAMFSEVVVREVSAPTRKRVLKQIAQLAQGFGCKVKRRPAHDPT